MKKYTVPILLFLSSNAFSQNVYDSYLVFHNNGSALNGIHSAKKAEDFSRETNLIQDENENGVIKYKNVEIDLRSSVEYIIKANKSKFKYKSDSNFGQRILDRLSKRTLVFSIQNIGDYLLFRENDKITCFNLVQEKPCSKSISSPTNFSNINPDGSVKILAKQLYFYNDKKLNQIYQCQRSIGFYIDKVMATCEGKKYINLNDLM